MSTYLYSNYNDFLCYVLIHVAEANNEVSTVEMVSILENTGHAEPAAMHSYYLKQSEAEREAYLKEMQQKWLPDDVAKRALLEKCQQVMEIDNEVDFMENAVYEQLIDLMYIEDTEPNI